MAFGDFLEGVGRASRATAIGALKGRRAALDRAEEERAKKVIEGQRDRQNELMQQLRDAQTEELAQAGVERKARRAALDAEAQAEANSFRDRYAGTDREFGPNVSDERVLVEGAKFVEADELEADRDNDRKVAATLAESQRKLKGISTPSSSTARTEEERIQAENVAAARRGIDAALTSYQRILDPDGEFSDLPAADRRQRAENDAKRRGHPEGGRGLQDAATAIQNAAASLQAQPAAAAQPAAGQRSAQELWDASVEEIGIEATTTQLGPRPTG